MHTHIVYDAIYSSYFGHRQGLVQLDQGNTTYAWTIDVLPGTLVHLRGHSICFNTLEGVPIEVIASDSGSVKQNVSTGIFTTSPNTHQRTYYPFPWFETSYTALTFYPRQSSVH